MSWFKTLLYYLHVSKFSEIYVDCKEFGVAFSHVFFMFLIEVLIKLPHHADRIWNNA